MAAKTENTKGCFSASGLKWKGDLTAELPSVLLVLRSSARQKEVYVNQLGCCNK